MVSKKVILTGSFGVGKTSLFNQFVENKFSDKYLTTIGVQVKKKSIDVDGVELSILLWDIAGEVSQDKVPVSYFLGASGIIYVYDLTRSTTFENIESDLEYLRKVLPEINIKVVGNKKDLLTEGEILEATGAVAVETDFTTSAKTGENVEALFVELGRKLL